MRLLGAGVAFAVRDLTSPCRDWFNDPWLKKYGYTADLCCWRGGDPRCWDSHPDSGFPPGAFSAEACCADFSTDRFEAALAAAAWEPGAPAVPVAVPFPLGDADAAPPRYD